MESICQSKISDYSPESIINFYSLYYCSLSENLYLFIPLSLLIFAICMYLLGSTADQYLCNALETISDNLNFSETISAVTLLALGNGAPDIFSSLSAAGSEEGIYLSLSCSLGGVLIITAIATSIVVLVSGDNVVSTDRSVFHRNTLFLLIAVFILIYTGMVKRCIDLATCALLLFLYAVYIVFVLKHDKQERNVKAKQQWMFNEMKETTFQRMNRSEFLNLMDEEKAYSLGIKLSGNISGTSSVIYDGEEIHPDEMLHFNESHLNIDEQRVEKHMKRLISDYKESAWSKVKLVLFKATKGNQESTKYVSYLEYIFSYLQIRRCTIPMTNTSDWNRNIDSFTPFLSTLFFLYVTGMLDLINPIQILILSLAFLLSIIIRCNTYHSEPPPSPYSGCFILFSFIMSIIWIWMLASIVIDLIGIYGIIFKISPTFLAVTFLSVGNCIGDLAAAYSISKKGYGGMAMIGCFACPLFNFLFGFSLSSARLLLFDADQSKAPLLNRIIEFNLFDEKAYVLLTCIVTITCIIAFFLIGVSMNNFKFSKKQTYVRMLIYICFVCFLGYLLFG